MSFTNVYYKRTAGTARACYVCYKPTATVLATINTVDFLYTCPGHLADHGFATNLGAGTGVTEEEIAKVKEEWEEKQRKKSEKEKEEASKSGGKVPGSLSTSTPSHERYGLHRDYFAMRLAEHRKRKQTAQAKDLAPRLPGAPGGAVVEEKY